MEFEDNSNNSDVGDNHTELTVDALVGEDKPFKDVHALAKSKVEADNFIEQLKNENAEMRKTVEQLEDATTKATTMEQILEAVRTLGSSGNPNEPTGTKGGEGAESGNQPNLSESDILNIVQRTLEKNQTAQQQQSNYESVRSAFTKQFKDPDKARLEYKSTAAALGMTEQQLDAYAKQNPKLVLRAAGLERAEVNSHTPSYLHSNQNSANAGADAGDGPKDSAWWSEQRRKRGNKWYFAPSTQQKYWRDANALGDSFIKKG